ncbi:long-chain fatty acid--CoA ligase [Undibacterium sp.]|uniref:AMP-dependent synthetase/ligase n=1 Tax=Undibacterium sp. TaxID=1914977 RepID=UPI0025CC2E36|nr:long-chain fatty acid--CoA ligase [Undibacterium sp.]
MSIQLKPLKERTLSELQTLSELFAWRAALTPQLEAYRQFNESQGEWISSSWLETYQRSIEFAKAIALLQPERGARIAILLPNSLNAVCMDQATLQLACVPVPMHALDNPASIAYILSDSDATLLIAATDQQWQEIAGTGIAMPALRQVVVLQKNFAQNEYCLEVPVALLDDWLASASAHDATAVLGEAKADDLAALVYTSGTTGKPKGVMLSHQNVMSNVKAVVKRVVPVSSDVFLSFLPLSHTFERTAGYYLPIAAGACVAYSFSVKQLPQELLTIRPTILISVPRIYERVYSALQNKLAQSKVQSWLVNAAIAIGWRRFNKVQGLMSQSRLQTMFDSLAWSVLEPLVADKLKSQFGGRLRVAVSGGAALSTAISRCFLSLGIPIVQGYGMTESSPVVAFNSPEDNNPATVGRVMDQVEVKIGENAELLVRGPNVMRGYWKREEDTAKAFIDGWLRTGDQAEVLDGRVRILGRVKEIIVTSTGEKIAPVDLEIAIATDPVFEQVYAFGDNAPFIACAVVLSQAYWASLSASLALDANAPASLHSPKAVDAVVQRMRALTTALPFYAQPKAAILSLEPWTIENTLITPTLKLKRLNLAKHFASDIQRLYTQQR